MSTIWRQLQNDVPGDRQSLFFIVLYEPYTGIFANINMNLQLTYNINIRLGDQRRSLGIAQEPHPCKEALGEESLWKVCFQESSGTAARGNVSWNWHLKCSFCLWKSGHAAASLLFFHTQTHFAPTKDFVFPISAHPHPPPPHLHVKAILLAGELNGRESGGASRLTGFEPKPILLLSCIHA